MCVSMGHRLRFHSLCMSMIWLKVKSYIILLVRIKYKGLLPAVAIAIFILDVRPVQLALVTVLNVHFGFYEISIYKMTAVCRQTHQMTRFTTRDEQRPTTKGVRTTSSVSQTSRKQHFKLQFSI